MLQESVTISKEHGRDTIVREYVQPWSYIEDPVQDSVFVFRTNVTTGCFDTYSRDQVLDTFQDAWLHSGDLLCRKHMRKIASLVGMHRLLGSLRHGRISISDVQVKLAFHNRHTVAVNVFVCSGIVERDMVGCDVNDGSEPLGGSVDAFGVSVFPLLPHTP